MGATRLLRISAVDIGPNRFHQNRTVSTADVDPALRQEILDIAQRQRVSHIHHHHQTNDFWRAVEIPERVAHGSKLPQPGKAQEIGLTEPAQKLAATLVERELVREIRAKPGMPVWRRSEEGRPHALIITKLGRAAIKVEDDRESENTELGAEASASTDKAASLRSERGTPRRGSGSSRR